MARFSASEMLFWSIPAGIAVVAAGLAYRALRREPEEPSRDAPMTRVSPCDAGRFLCRKGVVLATTGEETAEAGPDRCVRKQVGTCAQSCVAEGVTLAGLDEVGAKRQLCDMPESVGVYVMDERNFLNMPAADAASCEGDGFAPSQDGILQCILRSTVDPNALGVVVSTAKCRLGAVATLDRQPRLITRDQAIALWCRHDVAAAASIDTGIVDLGLDEIGSSPADAAAKSIDAAPAAAASGSSTSPIADSTIGG